MEEKKEEIIDDLIELNEENDNIDEILSQNELSLLYFTATWCGPCRKIYPSLCKLNDRLKYIEIYKIDIDKNEKLSEEKNIKSIPYFEIYEGDKSCGDCSGSDIIKVASLIKKIKFKEE
jgi:thiol-disulfide isomerase/thioredoxin